MLKKIRSHSFVKLRCLVNTLIPYNAMKLYVYIFKILDLKRFGIFENITSNCRPQFSDFSQVLSTDSIEIIDRSIISTTDSHIKCIVCICVSFLYSCLTFETFLVSICPRNSTIRFKIISPGFLYHFMSDPLETCGS